MSEARAHSADGVVKGGCVEYSIAGDRQYSAPGLPGHRSARHAPGGRRDRRRATRGRRVAARDCFRSSKVQPLALRRRDVRQDRLADQLVAEHELAADLARRQEPGPLRFIEGLGQRVVTHAGHLADDLGGEHLPDTAAATSTSWVDEARRSAAAPQPGGCFLVPRPHPAEGHSQSAMLVKQHPRLDKVRIDLLNETGCPQSRGELRRLLRRWLPGRCPQHPTHPLHRQPTQASIRSASADAQVAR